MHSLVQAFTLANCITFLFISCSNNRFFSSLLKGALRTDLSEFHGQNFKVGGTLGAEFVCFHIQGQLAPAFNKRSKPLNLRTND